MKCDELHPANLFEFEKVLKGKSNKLFYAKADVDTAIDELKANRQNLEDLVAYFQKKASDFHLMSDICRVKIKELVRTLWLARAERAKTAKNMFDILWKFASREKVGVTGCAHKIKGAKTLKEPKFFFAKFQITENKCRTKAEEYK